ncbi:ATP-binding protein [Kitasatospora sp. NPDC048540]|uniref:ATP-binding protein n=1 Tax=unclassified Kitasatospora TaxID=2633591 RepID=UPI0009EAB2E8|nr:ATP-binding protein [Kitasatospora sp. MBT63]
MAGWGEADRASHGLAELADDGPSACGAPALSELERLTPGELERTARRRLREQAEDQEARLPSRPVSAGVARRVVLGVLADWGLHQQLEAGELLTGELVANAVRHAGGRTIGLRVVRRPGVVRVEVRDSSRALPCLIMAAEPLHESGHGLRVVSEIADRWGADLLPRGKGVWFELKVRERTTA